MIKENSNLPSQIHYFTDNGLFSVSFSQDYNAKIIQSLDPNKAHGYDNISIHMLKIHGSSIYKPQEMICKKCIKTAFFLLNGNIAPIHKKETKKKNYRPVLLLPICGKILERLLFNEVFKFFVENKHIPSNQSGFKLSGSCVIYHSRTT